MTNTPDTRSRLKQVFAAHLARHGYAGVSLHAVAAESGIKKPSLYHHFPGGKDELYAEVAHDFIEDRHRALTAALATEGGLPEVLMAVVSVSADPSGAVVAFDQRLFDALAVVGEAVRTDVSATYVAKLLRPMEEFFRGAVDAGELAGPDAAFLANAFLHLARATDLAPADSTLPERLVRLFLDGAGRQG